MKALVLSAPEQLTVGDWPPPQCGAGDALIRPIAAGICTGHQYLCTGWNPYAKYPLVGGHEVCGEIVATGVLELRLPWESE